MWTDVIQSDLRNLTLGWSEEEAEIAAQDHALWKILNSQATSTDMHDADWWGEI